MISYCGREDNILARSLMMTLGMLEFAAVARLWSIFYLALLNPMRWLAGKTHTLAHRNWGYISMGKVLDKLKEDLEMIIQNKELINDKEYMMGLMSMWEDELPEFKTFRHDSIEKKKMCFFIHLVLRKHSR